MAASSAAICFALFGAAAEAGPFAAAGFFAAAGLFAATGLFGAAELFGGAGDSVKRTIGDFTIEYNRSFTALGGTGQNQIALPELAQTMLASYVSRMI